MILLLSALIGLLISTTATTAQQSQCPQFISQLPNGTCAQYPANGLCGSILGGQQVFLGFGVNFQILDSIAVKLINALEANRGIVDEDCRLAGDAFVCNSMYVGCNNVLPTNEAVPVLPCRDFCDNFWDKCQVAFDAFFIAGIETLGQPKESFSFPHCGPTGTWTKAPQPADVYGNRSVPGLGPFHFRLTGTPRYPDTSASFVLKNNNVINVPCSNPVRAIASALDTSAFGLPVECAFPLVEQSGECKIPCPFPVIPVDQQDQIGLAFVVPAIIALVFCLFVFADSCFVIFESQGFNEILRRQRKRLMFRGGSTTDTDEGTGTSGEKSGAKRRRNALRAATLYSLFGAALGIVYFLIGPLMTLIRGSKISCGVEDNNLDLLQFVLGQAERSDGYCRAQRVAPFILQLVFNLILYAIVRVFMVVTERTRRMTSRQNRGFDALLISYCLGIPILFLIVASEKDELSSNLADFVTQFSRNSAICVMRLSVADEVILIFMPFIITGCLICGLSYYIYTHLTLINANVKGIVGSPGKNAERSSSATALRLLIIRLSFLGVSTFVVLLVFISATASLMVSMSEFSPRFNAFFLCTATQATLCLSCEAERALMLDKLPPSAAFAAQIAAMSSITLLFGGFFAAQSAARLYKEYQDGSLKLKVVNLWYGRPANFGRDKLESSFQSFHDANNGIAEVVKESCATLLCLRLKKFRDSMRDGRARGQVFRWGKGAAPNKQRKQPPFSVVNAWNTSKPDEKAVQWQGVVGGGDHGQWSSSNTNFADSSRSPQSMSTFAPKDPSWGYSETKLTSATKSNQVYFDPPGNSATRREEFTRPPTLPEI